MTTSSPKSRVEINRDSDAKRGIMSKTFKLHESTVDLVKELSAQTDKSQAQIITEALQMYKDQLSKSE